MCGFWQHDAYRNVALMKPSMAAGPPQEEAVPEPAQTQVDSEHLHAAMILWLHPQHVYCAYAVCVRLLSLSPHVPDGVS